MRQIRSAYIYGAAVASSWEDKSKSLNDLIFDGVSAAMKDAGVGISGVDSVVLAAHDLIDGRSLSSMVTAPAAGAYLKDEVRVSDDGLAALSLASARVEAGESDLTVVAAWGRASEGNFLSASRAAMSPFTEQPFGLSELDISAFRLSRWMMAHAGALPQRRAALAARQDRAARNPRALNSSTVKFPVAYPLLPEESPIWADVVTAVIIGSGETRARVAGVGHSVDDMDFGSRDILAMPAIAEATERALARAGTSIDELDAIEIDGLMLSDEAIALEALGICAPGAGFRIYAESTRINQSGGGGAGWCFPAMGLVRLAECYFAIRDGNGSKPRKALAVGTNNGAQTSTAVVLEAI